jgi:hypothetical protein
MLSFKNLFKKNKTNIRNCHHIDFANLVEPAFIGHGVHSDKTQYYRFKGNSELDMIAGRYNTAIKFFYEMNMRMSSEDLKFYLEKIEGAINSNEVRLSEIAKWVSVIKDRTQLLIDNKTAHKLASASYFDEHESLDGYDFQYNLKKIKAWEEGGDYSFFFHEAYERFTTASKHLERRFWPDEKLYSSSRNSKREPYEATKKLARVIQDAIDEQKIQYKKLAKFNPNDESIYKNMTTYEYFFHIHAIKENQRDANRTD